MNKIDYFINETFETERKYLEFLNVLYDVYFVPFNKLNLKNEIVNNFIPYLKPIIDLHTEIVDGFNRIGKDNISAENKVTGICDILSRNSDKFRVYLNYFRDNQRFIEEIHNLLSKKKFRAIIDEGIKNPNCDGLNFASIEIMPIQRLPRYILLLKELSKCINENNNNVKEKITTTSKSIDIVIQECNKSLNEYIAESTVKRIFDEWGKNILILKPNRKFIKEGDLYKKKDKKYRFVLFNDSLMYGQASIMGKSIKFHNIFNLNEIRINDLNENKYALSFQLVSSIKSFVVTFSNENDMKSWKEAINTTKENLINNNPTLSVVVKYAFDDSSKYCMNNECSNEFGRFEKRIMCYKCGRVCCEKCLGNNSRDRYKCDICMKESSLLSPSHSPSTPRSSTINGFEIMENDLTFKDNDDVYYKDKMNKREYEKESEMMKEIIKENNESIMMINDGIEKEELLYYNEESNKEKEICEIPSSDRKIDFNQNLSFIRNNTTNNVIEKSVSDTTVGIDKSRIFERRINSNRKKSILLPPPSLTPPYCISPKTDENMNDESAKDNNYENVKPSSSSDNEMDEEKIKAIANRYDKREHYVSTIKPELIIVNCDIQTMKGIDMESIETSTERIIFSFSNENIDIINREDSDNHIIISNLNLIIEEEKEKTKEEEEVIQKLEFVESEKCEMRVREHELTSIKTPVETIESCINSERKPELIDSESNTESTKMKLIESHSIDLENIKRMESVMSPVENIDTSTINKNNKPEVKDNESNTEEREMRLIECNSIFLQPSKKMESVLSAVENVGNTLKNVLTFWNRWLESKMKGFNIIKKICRKENCINFIVNKDKYNEFKVIKIYKKKKVIIEDEEKYKNCLDK